MSFDMNFNNADNQTEPGLIPHGTEVKVNMFIRSGGVGPDGWMTQSKSSDSLMLDCEFTVLVGPYAKRKFWGFLILQGSEKAVNIGRSQIRAMIESSLGILPNDSSEQACKRRAIQGIGQIDGIEFACKVGIDKAALNSGYEDKNRLMTIITPDNKSYQTIISGQSISPAEVNGNNGGYVPQSATQVSPDTTNSWQQPQQPAPAQAPQQTYQPQTAPQVQAAQEPATSPVPAWASAPTVPGQMPAEDDIPF